MTSKGGTRTSRRFLWLGLAFVAGCLVGAVAGMRLALNHPSIKQERYLRERTWAEWEAATRQTLLHFIGRDIVLIFGTRGPIRYGNGGAPCVMLIAANTAGPHESPVDPVLFELANELSVSYLCHLVVRADIPRAKALLSAMRDVGVLATHPLRADLLAAVEDGAAASEGVVRRAVQFAKECAEMGIDPAPYSAPSPPPE